MSVAIGRSHFDAAKIYTGRVMGGARNTFVWAKSCVLCSVAVVKQRDSSWTWLDWLQNAKASTHVMPPAAYTPFN